MTLPEPIIVTLTVVDALDALQVPYLLGGSLASAVHGAPRATLDADIVAELRAEHVEPLAGRLGDAFYFDLDTMRQAVRQRSSFNLIHLTTMFKVDVFVSKGRPYDRAQMDRRAPQVLSPDARPIYTASAEDIVLAKLEWYRLGGEVSERQWRDVAGVLHTQGNRLDRDYLRRWAGVLGVLELLSAPWPILFKIGEIMKMSRLFGRTLREAPSDAETVGHQLLVRAGFIRQLGAGIFSYLPFAQRSITKVQTILREEINAIGGQEITMPVVHPADTWQETGRWYQIGSEMGRFKDRNDRDMVLAMTHEEVVADLLRTEVQSYKQLPRLIYHIQTKWRDDPRPRAGLIRVREFTMKDSYSLDSDLEGLDAQYRAHYQAYFNIFHRCGLPVITVKSDVGMMGGKLAHEFMYLTPIGEDTLIICPNCGYTANRQIARFRKPAPEPEPLLPIEKVATPHLTTIKGLAEFLHIPTSRTAKAVFMVATITEGPEDKERFVFAVVRGDMDLNETKLVNAVHAKDLRPAHEEEIRAVGAVPGYASPVGLRDVLVVVDDLVAESPNLVAGANEEGYHLLNVKFGRDYQADLVTDIALVDEGYPCPECGAPLNASRGVEVGNIFKLGTRYSDSMGCTFSDKDGKSKSIVMGSYGIGVGRLLGCVAEEHHDERGLIWPITLSPFHVHLIGLPGQEEAAGSLYEQLQAHAIEVLYDDRDERAGVKFNDADLIGIPIRLTVSPRSMRDGGVELKLRRDDQARITPLAGLVPEVQAIIAAMHDQVAQKVIPVPYD